MLNISLIFSDDHVQVVVVDESGFSSTIKLSCIDEVLEFIDDQISYYEY